MKEKHSLRILWLSVSPHIHTGYGGVTKNICFRLRALGFPIIIVAYYGIAEAGMLELGGCPILPISQHNDNYGKRSVPYYISKFKIDLPILLSDFWYFDWFAKLDRSCFYGPIDSSSYGRQYIKVLEDYKDFITISKFGQQEALKYGRKTLLIPHGVNTDIFRPLDKDRSRSVFGFPRDKFLVGIVAANSDPEPRKGWDKMFLGIKLFLENFPKVRKSFKVFAYTQPNSQRGFDLPGLSSAMGLDKTISFPELLPRLVGLPDEEMAFLYNSFDLLMNCSRREGFGLPILEAESCGVPVIGTNFSSMIELIKGHGWLVKEKDVTYTPILGKSVIPDQEDIAKKLEEAYFEPKKRQRYGELSRKFALRYDWENIIKTGWVPFLEKKEDLLGEVSPSSIDFSWEELFPFKEKSLKGKGA